MRLPTVRRRDAVALADLPRLGRAARRTSLVRVVLALGLAATLAALLSASRHAGTGRAAVLPEGATTGVVALDMSASISGAVYARVATTLRGIVAANQAIGLVMFSDTAYELVPPNSPPVALLQFVPFFIPAHYYRGAPIFGQSPWDQFSGGTRASTGLVEAQRALQRAHVAHGAILLVSDLDNAAADGPALEREALLLRRDHVPVRIVPLFAAPDDRAYFAALFGEKAFVDPRAFTHTARRREQPITAGAPWDLLALGTALVLLLAGNERWNTRLSLGAAA